jgi:hypothetical protein
VKGYNTGHNTYAWTPSQAGIYTFEVRSRIAGSMAAYEGRTWLTFVVVDFPLVSFVTVESSKSSPQPLGTVGTVTITGKANGDNAGSYEYEIHLKHPVTGWSIVKGYKVGNNTYAWTPSQAGSYIFEVRTRVAGSTAAYEARAQLYFTVTP